MFDREVRGLEPPRTDGEGEKLGLSVAWGYAFGFLLIVFIFLFLVPEAEGPSPWDGEAFRKGILEMFANFRLLDELADLSIVRIADVGEGVLDADLDLLVVSNRKFGWAPFGLAILFVSLALLLRGIRQRLLSSHLGIPSSVEGQLGSYFFGRGLSLFFPFGAGEFAISQHLIHAGADPKTSAKVVFYNRTFEVLAVIIVLLGGFAYLGWDGALEPIFWSVLIVTAVVSVTRPLGGTAQEPAGWNPLKHIWLAFNGRALIQVTSAVSRHSGGLMIGLCLVAVAALGLEILGYWCIKQAFSSPMDDYILMKDLPFVPFAIVISVANMARVLPYTFASFGVYEIVSVAMFRVFDEHFLSGTTVALLDSLLLNGVILTFFIVSLWVSRCPSVLEVWRSFFKASQEARRRLGNVSPGLLQGSQAGQT